MKDTVELVFILDRSGSMALEQDTIGGFNSLIEKQKIKKVAMRRVTCLFNQLQR